LPELLALRDKGLRFLDVEVLWIGPGAELTDDHRHLVDVGLQLGADHVLVVSDEPDPSTLAPALRQLTDWCDGRIKPMLEFLRITAVSSLAQATTVLDACEGHDFGILLDALHMARSDELAQPLERLERFPYVQLCDGKERCADDRESLLDDAINGRLAPGEGELGLAGFLDQLPVTVPLSLEVRSAVYRDRYPDPIERSQAVLDRTMEFLADE